MKASLVLHDGPLDGAEIKWPNDAGDFPAVIQFGFYADDGTDTLREPKVISHHRYEAFHSWADGPLDPLDGLPENEVQEYLHEGCSLENVPSVVAMWDK
jgi:hypothetical protein